jgi:predicted phosphodiesterase
MLYTRAVIAVLYDVHGNLPALEAVVADARARAAERWILGGDYALFGPEPEATVALLRGLAPATWIRGNGERWTAAPDEAPDNPIVPDAIAACRAALGADEVAALGALPFDAVDGDARYVHGSPVSDVRSFMPRPGDDEAELLAGVTTPRLVFGHTHLPFRRIAGAVELVNPGSVGMPFDGDQRAAYALVHDTGRVEHVRVPYDQGAAAARMRSRWPGAGWAETVARRIEQARMDV